jgi:hypothetical protein
MTVAACFLVAGLVHAGDLQEPFQLMAGDEPIDVGGIGYAAPFVGDFNMDGRRDLLVGQFSEGKMRVFLNEGTDAMPKFSKDYVWFKEGAATGRVPTG